MKGKKRILAFLLMIAACMLFAASTLAMLYGFEPFYSSYYSFAWWSYIIFVESFLYRRGGRSLLYENSRKFLLLLPLSATIWLLFEALNFRLLDWHYINIPSNTLVRWTGYPSAYSTVLPGIFSTKALLEFLGIAGNLRTAPLSDPRRLYKPFTFAGILFVILPLAWPEYFFPLIWLAFVFLLEPVNHKAGTLSLLRDLEKGVPGNLILLLLSGAFCGLLWETWNFWAGAKWVYSLPHLGFLKIFEMPLLGFLGFPPFAVECYTMTASFFLLISKIGEKHPTVRALGIYTAVAALMLLFDLLVLTGIDRFTVMSFQNFIPFGPRP
jgi:hypothetical protein